EKHSQLNIIDGLWLDEVTREKFDRSCYVPPLPTAIAAAARKSQVNMLSRHCPPNSLILFSCQTNGSVLSSIMNTLTTLIALADNSKRRYYCCSIIVVAAVAATAVIIVIVVDVAVVVLAAYHNVLLHFIPFLVDTESFILIDKWYDRLKYR
ncbi:hypothetical protein WUBG_05918, partial [Wuchereria bancrofti]